VLSVLGDRSEKNILSLTAAGRAREYQLVRTFSFRVHGLAPAQSAAQPKYSDAPARAGPTEYIPPSTITLRREITFSDDLVLSKESEEILLWRDIQGDLVQQLMRRLAAAKLQPVKQD
jgi:LPS-assembly lipoprotein